MQPNQTKPNQIFNYIGLMFLFILFMNKSFSQTITSPENGKVYNSGVNMEFSWEKYNNNTDRYRWIRAIALSNPTTGDIIKLKPDTGIVEESWWYGKLRRKIGDYYIPCGYAGKITFTVEAQKRIFLSRRKKRFVAQSNPQLSTSTYIDIVAVEPTNPRVFINCDQQNEYGITITPLNPNYTIRWYNDLTTKSAFHDGNFLKVFYGPGLTTMFVSQVLKKNDCEFESVRVPVSVYTLDPQIIKVDNINRELAPDDDPRLPGYARCNDPSKYQDLEQVQIDAIIAPVNIESSYVRGSVIYVPAWTHSNDYEGNTKRVCYNKLDNKPDGCETYTLKFTPQIYIEAIDPTSGNPIANTNDNEKCTPLVAANVTLCQQKLCVPNWVKAGLIYPAQNDGCAPDLIRSTLVCSSSNKVIGPNENLFTNTSWIPNPNPQLGNFYKIEYSFDWTVSNTKDASGLSSSNIKNPNVYHDIIPVKDNQYYKYYLKVTQKTRYCDVLNQATENCMDDVTKEKVENLYFCYFVYRCKRCISGQRIMVIEEEEVIEPKSEDAINIAKKISSSKLDIFPNPAFDVLNINYISENYENVIGYIIGIDGKILQTFDIKDNSTLQINVETLNAGIYYISINNNGLLNSKKLIIFE